MLPISGAGKRFLQRKNGREFEVRLSAAKPHAYYSEQRRTYVTQTITNQNDDSIFVMWDPQKCEIKYTNILEQGETHIPWEIYDYDKFNIGIPKCQCQ